MKNPILNKGAYQVPVVPDHTDLETFRQRYGISQHAILRRIGAGDLNITEIGGHRYISWPDELDFISGGKAGK